MGMLEYNEKSFEIVRKPTPERGEGIPSILFVMLGLLLMALLIIVGRWYYG